MNDQISTLIFKVVPIQYGYDISVGCVNTDIHTLALLTAFDTCCEASSVPCTLLI